VSRVAYFDSSAIVKLVITERETSALRAWMSDGGNRLTPATSAITRVEVIRACAQSGLPDAVDRATDLLAEWSLISLTEATLALAARLTPPSLRSLDAIHLATALELEESLDAFVAYDDRLVEAARGAGLPVAVPT
jgi:predicted nucleic acid-binding protein